MFFFLFFYINLINLPKINLCKITYFIKLALLNLISIHLMLFQFFELIRQLPHY